MKIPKSLPNRSQISISDIIKSNSEAIDFRAPRHHCISSDLGALVAHANPVIARRGREMKPPHDLRVGGVDTNPFARSDDSEPELRPDGNAQANWTLLGHERWRIITV